jgi:ATP-dependent RNA/DNA helicase IGHMBP2
VSSDSTLESLINYIGQHGVVHSAEQYLSDLEIPKEVLQNQKLQSHRKVKNEKGAEMKPKRQKKKRIQVQEKLAVNISSEKKENQQVRGEQVREDYYQTVLQEFINKSEQVELKFPKSISAYDRRLIHEVASKLNLLHISVGEGNDRYIVVHKAPAARHLIGNMNTVDKSSDILKVKIGESNFVPSQHVKSSAKHAINPSANQSAPKPDEHSDMKKSEYKKDVKASKKSRKRQEPEDFDSVIAEFQEMDKRCAWGSCRIPTDLVGLNCVYCRQRYCVSHGLPEVHGCGEAACKSAKHELRHPKPVKLDHLKRSSLSKKLEKKLIHMAEERKSQKKES